MSFVIFLILCVSSAYRVQGEINISKLDETNRNEHEKVYCADIWKQPAFDHPKLKNHKIEMEPSFPLDQTQGKPQGTLHWSRSRLLEVKRCPNGMVPIRMSQGDIIHPLTFDNPGAHYATIKTTMSNKTYHGAGATLNLQNPPVEGDQLSGALIWIDNATSRGFNMIAVGWVVSRQLYGDNHTRLTGYWTVDHGGSKQNCINMLCPGFVQVHASITLGTEFEHTSIYGGQQYASPVVVSQSPKTGNWWLAVDDHIFVGYWPKEIFTHLATGATSIAYGGIAYNLPKQPSPQMGNGDLPSLWNPFKACFYLYVQVFNEDYKLVDVDSSSMEYSIDSKNCYGVLSSWNHHEYHQTFSFGGPGGEACGI